jgi:hypothetical protein
MGSRRRRATEPLHVRPLDWGATNPRRLGLDDIQPVRPLEGSEAGIVDGGDYRLRAGPRASNRLVRPWAERRADCDLVHFFSHAQQESVIARDAEVSHAHRALGRR